MTQGSAQLHPGAWVAWLIAAVLPALSTRNPLYLSLTLLAVAVVHIALGRKDALARRWGAFVRLGASLWALTIPFTALTAHHGELILLRLPAHWPVIGGPITAEALIYGLTGGLALLTLLLAFATFNVAVDQARLLRMTPGFLYQAGVVAAIAVAFVPQMVAGWEAIREAQAVRGHRVRGIRDLLPLLLPLLITALERAIQLAESMEARGFGGQPPAPGQQLRQQAGLLGGLSAVGLGVAGLGFWPGHWLPNVLLAIGLAVIGWSLWAQGRQAQRSLYRRWTWRRPDRIMLGAGLIGAAGWLAAWIAPGNLLLYYPYPPYSPWPAFHPLVGALILLLVTPALVLPAPTPVA